MHNKESVTCEKKRVTEQDGLNATKLACVQEIGEGRGGGGEACTQATKFEAAPVLFLSGVYGFCSRCRRCCLNLPPSRELKQQRRQRQRKRLLKSELALFQRTAGDTAHACALLPVSLQSRSQRPRSVWSVTGSETRTLGARLVSLSTWRPQNGYVLSRDL